MNTKRMLLLVATAAMLLVFTGGLFAAGQAETGAAEPVTLNVHQAGDPGLIDPTADWNYEVEENMFVPLVGYDAETGDIYPRGATSWTVSSDNIVWTFKIRQGWKWSDGNPVTAKDYEYAFRTIVNPETAAPHAWRLSIIKNADAVQSGDVAVDQLGVKALDDSTLQIELNQPASWFLLSLTSIGQAVPQWTREEFGLDWTLPENIVVNGPYILTKWVPDDYLILEKNPSYYDADKVQIEKINLLIVPADSTALAMYENGELDQVVVPPNDLDRIKKDPVLSKEFTNVSKMNLYFYWFNTLDPPFDNVLVRKAFAAAVDKKTLVSAITKGGEVVLDTATPPGCFGYVEPSEGVGIPFDPKKAAAYLAEAGYPNGKGLPTVRLGFGATEIHTNIAQAVQKMWKDALGVTVELKAHEGGGYGTAASGGEFSVYRWGWGMDYPDANNIHAELFHSDVASERSMHSAEYDQLIDAAAVEVDLDKRKELYKQAEKILVEDEVGIIPFYASAFNAVTKPYLDAVIAPVFIKHWWLWKIN